MSSFRTGAAAAAAAFFLAAVPVHAQSRQPSVFVTGGVFGAIQRFSHIEADLEDGDAPDLSGATAGGTIGVGTFVASRVSIRFELALRGTLDASETVTQSIGPGFSYTSRQTYEDRIRTGYVLIGYHTRGDRRVSVEYLGGLGIVQDRQSVAFERTSNAPGLPSSSDRLSAVGYGSVAVVGLDVRLAAGSQFAVVPGIRTFASGSSVSLEPGVSVRWSF